MQHLGPITSQICIKPDIGKYQMYKLYLTYSSLLQNTFFKSADLLSSLFTGHPYKPGPTELSSTLQPVHY